MSVREEEILLGQIVSGIVDAATPRTVIATVIDGNEVDRTSCLIRVGQDTRRCMVLIPNIRVRTGNRIKVRPDGNGRYEMVGGVEASDAVSGVFSDPSTDSPFPPSSDDPQVGPVEDPPVGAETRILDRRPENEYGPGGTVIEPTGGRTGTNPEPPTGAGGNGPLFPIDIPNTVLRWATDDQIAQVGDGEIGGSGEIRRIPHADHVHAHGDRPVVRWPFGHEPHAGYAYSGHTHPGQGGESGGVPVREEVPVPANDTTKTFSTRFSYEPGSLFVFLNGVKQTPWVDATTPADAWEYREEQADAPQIFTFHDDVIVDGTTIDQDVPDVIEAQYWHPVPEGSDNEPPAPPAPCITNVTVVYTAYNEVIVEFDTVASEIGYGAYRTAGMATYEGSQREATPRQHHRLGWGGLSADGGISVTIALWSIDPATGARCDAAPLTVDLPAREGGGSPSGHREFSGAGVSDITATTALLSAEMTAAGQEPLARYGTDLDDLATEIVMSFTGMLSIWAEYELALTGLTPAMRYYAKFTGYDFDGSPTFFQNDNFYVTWVTATVPAGPITLIDGGARDVGDTVAIVYGEFSRSCGVTFEWGEQGSPTIYSESAESSDVVTGHTWALSGLVPETTYQGRFRVHDPVSGTGYVLGDVVWTTTPAGVGPAAGWGQGPWGTMPWGS